MIGYKDMTFCPFFKECEEKNCFRALTDEIVKGAHDWWGCEDAPICVFADKPSCFKGGK